MVGLFCIAFVLICIMEAAVRSQPTIGDAHITCPENELSEMLLQQNNRLGHILESERQLVQELRKRVSTIEKTGSCLPRRTRHWFNFKARGLDLVEFYDD